MNPYEILGVNREATAEEIKRAYRQRAKECHPDANRDDPQAEVRFKQVSEAYAILKDPAKRQQFDMFGSSGGHSRGGGFGFEFFDLSEAMRLFTEAFSGQHSTRRGRRVKGKSLHIEVELSLEELYNGVTREITYDRMTPCGECGGTGIPAGAAEKSCQSCNGSGYRKVVRSTLLGSFSSMSTCPDCGGTGRIIEERCQKCSGEGREYKKEKIKIEFPPGAADGNYRVISGMGNAGIAGGSPGDFVAYIKQKHHDTYNRRGDDLYYRLPISFSTAALGDSLDVPTIEGETAKLKIPPGTQFGTTFRIKKKGMPHLNSGGRGDMIVTVYVQTPRKLSRDEKKLFEQLRKFDPEHESEHDSESLFDRLKDLFE